MARLTRNEWQVNRQLAETPRHTRTLPHRPTPARWPWTLACTLLGAAMLAPILVGLARMA